MKQLCTYQISRAAEPLHWECVEVPEGTEALKLETELSSQWRGMAYILVKDPDGTLRLQKMTAGGKQKIRIGKKASDTTIGGVPGRIPAGEWKIGLRIFPEHIEKALGESEKNVEITVTDEAGGISDPIGGDAWMNGVLELSPELFNENKLFCSEERWYKGDFHTHTRLSDGKESVPDAMKKAEAMGMDFYVPTEHNVIHTGWCGTKICILPGVEFTTEKGHMNLFGITSMPDGVRDILLNRVEESQMEACVEKIIREAEEKGWITSINHPFLTVWKWRYEHTPLEKINCLEVINDPTYPDGPESNERAVHFLDLLWQDGHRIYGVGGSDAHNRMEERYEGANLPSVPGDPGTFVFAHGLSPAELMRQVRQGYMYTARYMQVELSITDGLRNWLPGDRLPDELTEFIYRAKIRMEKPPVADGAAGAEFLVDETPLVDLISDSGRTHLPVEKTGRGEYCVKIGIYPKPQGWQWFRLELRSGDGTLRGYVNPVYKGARCPSYTTFGEALHALEEKETAEV